MFSERLDLLMRLTDTTNSALARAIAFDPSYISKIRSGKRRLPRNDVFFQRAVPYFARNLTGIERGAVQLLFGGQALPENRAQVEALLTAWLREGESGESVRRLLLGASELKQPPRPVPGTVLSMPAAPASIPVLVFCGNEGKRQGVELFLSRLCAAEGPHTLLLSSDEEMSWLYEDAAFVRRWSALLTRFLSLGGRVRIIHTVSRNVTELMEALKGWMPLYLTGRIEPYYCPRLRDGVYHRSLFVAQGHSALVSSSVMHGTAGMPNLLFEDAASVGAFEKEFWNYFALCRPLMRIYRGAQDGEALLRELRRTESGDSLFLAQSLPGLATMPRSVLAAMAGPSLELLETHRAHAAAALRGRLERGAQTVELLNLPPLRDLGKTTLPLWPLLGLPGLVYTPELLARHLRAELELTERYDNYRVVLTGRISPELMVSVSEGGGAMLLCPLPAGFSMEEQNLTRAMQEYLQRIAEGSKGKTLAEYLRALEGGG